MRERFPTCHHWTDCKHSKFILLCLLIYSSVHLYRSRFLHNNRLQRVPPGTFTGMPRLRRLRLDSNALVCDCQMFWLAKMLNDSAIQAAANCDAPQDMYGKPLKGMSAHDFHCS